MKHAQILRGTPKCEGRLGLHSAMWCVQPRVRQERIRQRHTQVRESVLDNELSAGHVTLMPAFYPPLLLPLQFLHFLCTESHSLSPPCCARGGLLAMNVSRKPKAPDRAQLSIYGPTAAVVSSTRKCTCGRLTHAPTCFSYRNYIRNE